MKHLSNLYQRKLVMNLQRFGDDPEGGAPAGEGQGTGEGQQQEEKMFTRAQLGSIVAAEVKKATEAIEQEKLKAIEKAKTEAEELALLSEDKREEALLQKEREKLEKEREEFQAEQLMLEKQKQLTVERMPATFAKRVIGETAEEILADIQEFKTEFDAAVREAVKFELKQSVDEPLGSNGGSSTSVGSSIAEERNKKDKVPTNSLWD